MRRKPAKEKARPRLLVNAEQLAAIVNLKKRRIFQLVEEGMPKKHRGRYDVDECQAWYIRYLQAAIGKKSLPIDEGGIANEREARLRNLRTAAELKEIKLARIRGGLVSIEDVDREMTELVVTSRAQILSIAPRLAPELLGETERVMLQAKISKALGEALCQLAQRK